MSVVTIAELRAGHLKAGWGTRRRLETERAMRRIEQCPVDRSVAESWAVLKDATRKQGRPCSDNDLWIAATALARDVPVLTCDRDFVAMGNSGVKVIYVPRRLTAQMRSPG